MSSPEEPPHKGRSESSDELADEVKRAMLKKKGEELEARARSLIEQISKVLTPPPKPPDKL